MVTGWKTLPADVQQPPVIGATRAVVLLGCSAIAVAVLANVL
jgi:hypothetical protein